jgi:hypothetical protein
MNLRCVKHACIGAVRILFRRPAVKAATAGQWTFILLICALLALLLAIVVVLTCFEIT